MVIVEQVATELPQVTVLVARPHVDALPAVLEGFDNVDLSSAGSCRGGGSHRRAAGRPRQLQVFQSEPADGESGLRHARHLALAIAS